MAVYTVNLLVVVLFSYLAYFFRGSSPVGVRGEKKPLIWFVIFVILSLSLVSGLRFLVGTDYVNYTILFYDSNNYKIGTENLEDIEIGFILLCRFVYLFSHSPFSLFLVSSFIINIIIVLSIREASDIFWLSCFLYIAAGAFYSTFNVLRQSLAMAIVFLAVIYLMKGKTWQYFLLVCIASLFHLSALIMLPVYFIVTRRAWSPVFLVLIIFELLIFVFYSQFVNLLMVFLVNTRYTSYKDVLLNAERGVNLVRYFVALAPILLAFLFRKKLEKVQGSNVLINMALLGFLLFLLALKQVYFARVCIYFSMFIVLLIPRVISVIEDKRLRYLLTFCILICYVTYSYFIMPRDAGLLPYQTIFDAPEQWNIFNYIVRY
jgi:transmembrane protein EpsG